MWAIDKRAFTGGAAFGDVVGDKLGCRFGGVVEGSPAAAPTDADV